MIKTFKSRSTKTLFEGRSVRAYKSFERVAQRKLAMVNAATQLSDLKSPPGNKLHPLKGDRAGQHSISINDQYRICFVWKRGDAHDVEIVDYHD